MLKADRLGNPVKGCFGRSFFTLIISNTITEKLIDPIWMEVCYGESKVYAMERISGR